MRLLRLFRPNSHSSALARAIASVFGDDPFIFLLGGSERLRVLDRAAAELAGLRCRVVRAGANEPGELGLAELLQQISTQLPSRPASMDHLEWSHRLLTEADAGCDKIVLLIDEAHRLTSSALRFLQLTSRSGPNLRVVLASVAVDPVAPEFTLLQARSACIRLDPVAPQVSRALDPAQLT